MSQHGNKYIKKSEKYKGVYLSTIANGELYFVAQISVNGKSYKKHYKTEKEAAKAVDVFLINNKKEPVNILIKKK